MKSYYAHHISCSQDDDVFSIGLADDEFDPVDFLILTRNVLASENTNQPIELLVNELDIELHNAIESVRCFDQQVFIQLNTSVADELDYDSIHVELTDQFDEVLHALKKMLRGTAIPLQLN